MYYCMSLINVMNVVYKYPDLLSCSFHESIVAKDKETINVNNTIKYVLKAGQLFCIIRNDTRKNGAYRNTRIYFSISCTSLVSRFD
jgi:hypothetical protein